MQKYNNLITTKFMSDSTPFLSVEYVPTLRRTASACSYGFASHSCRACPACTWQTSPPSHCLGHHNHEIHHQIRLTTFHKSLNHTFHPQKNYCSTLDTDSWQIAPRFSHLLFVCFHFCYVVNSHCTLLCTYKCTVQLYRTSILYFIKHRQTVHMCIICLHPR